jgi:hypothetical protein
VIRSRPGVHIGHAVPKLRVRFRVLQLQCALLIRRDHRHAIMHRAEHLAMHLGVNAVRQLGEPIV